MIEIGSSATCKFCGRSIAFDSEKWNHIGLKPRHFGEPAHELKTWSEYFQATKRGLKSFEPRKNDRDFQVNEYIVLREYSPERDVYTGDALVKKVVYILHGGVFGLPEDICILQLG